MTFEGLDISIGGDSAGAKGAIASVKSSLSGLERSANSAQDSVEELGDEASGTGGRLSALGATAGASAVTLFGFSSAATGATTSLSALGVSVGTVTTGLVGLAAVAAPLAATIGSVAAAAGGLATAFGAVVGSGLVAFGERRAEQNREQLEQINQRIARLERLRDTEAGLTAAQEQRLEQLEERADRVEETTSVTGALSEVVGDLKAEITPLVVDLGEEFIPLIEDAIDAIPELAENIIEALGPLDEFRDALREFGAFAAGAIPDLVEAFVDLGRDALPVVQNLADAVADGANSAFEGMIEVAERVGDDLIDIAGAAADLIPELTAVGATIIEGAAPAVESLIGFIEDLIGGFNDFTRSAQGGAVFRQIKQEIIPLIPRIQKLFAEFKPLLSTLVDNLPQIIDLFGGFADSVLDIANTVIPVIVPPLRLLIDLIGGVSGALAKWIERSDQGRNKISSDALYLKSTYQSVVSGIQNALSSLRQFTANTWNLHPFSDTFEAVASTITGGDEAIIPTLVSDIKSAFQSLREWFATVWDLVPLSGAFSEAFDAAADAIESGLDGAVNAINNVLDPIATAFENTVGAIGDLRGINLDINVPQPEDLIPDGVPIIGGGGGGGGGDNPNSGIGGGDGDGGETGTGGDETGIGGPGTGLATGGLVTSPGVATLAENGPERVLPNAQVDDRGRASFDPSSVADGFDDSEVARELSEKLDRIDSAIRDDGTVRLSDRDLVRGLERLFDRHGGNI